MGSDEKTLAERAAAGARALDEATRVKNAEQDERLQKDRARAAAWLARACTPPSRGWLGFLGRKQADVDGERAWLAALPFRVEKYEDLFNESIAVHRWALRFEFAGARPEEALLTNLFANLDTSASIGTVRITPDRRDLYVELPMSDALRRSGSRSWEIRLLFHRAVDEVLVPLHREYPLALVECGEDHHFDMRSR